jgi:hypothetical protein
VHDDMERLCSRRSLQMMVSKTTTKNRRKTPVILLAQRNSSQSGGGVWSHRPKSLNRGAPLVAQRASSGQPCGRRQRAGAPKRQTKPPVASCCPLPPPHPHCYSIYSNTTYILIGFHTSSPVFSTLRGIGAAYTRD